MFRASLRVRLGSWAPHRRERGVEAIHHFHVHRRARDTYGFSDSFFNQRGDVIFVDHYSAHQFAQTLRAKKDVRPAELHAMGLIHELLHVLISAYRSAAPNVFSAILGKLQQTFGEDLDQTLLTFLDRFPPPAVYRGEKTVAQFLSESHAGLSNREWALEELLLLWISNQNPGYEPIRDLIGDEELRRQTRYLPILESVRSVFDDQLPKFGPASQSLLDMLLEPIRRSPNSLIGQLEFMRLHWGAQLEHDSAFAKLLGGIDFIREEGLWFERKSHFAGGEDVLVPPSFRGEYYESEPEQFSQDLDWMPRVVMIAKSTFVWLDQLSKKYQRPIMRLSDIPAEELALLHERGFTALWLIGLWRRSSASKRIKQIQGNREAIASAYSLDDYEIAPELGGDSAYRELRDRAARHGLRLASDMVPNHMGIDSRWVIEHPERFIQSDRSPFPNYTFDGPNLSTDPRVSLFLEDGYWRRSDAAVVFKRVDHSSGEVRYFYHGNDGTSMPWNDTAQLNYLDAGVREAVIQTILHVARKFPIIRFDAAMTLAKKHYQRLWFPLPGTGGAIPSRAEHAMARERFEELFPNEFWREVVDRVAVEAPNTLLLAEAFWLMEGYFVRTLGMHRVYNSAFMNMLKREDNAGYRTSMKNVLEFNPQILKRHVNFMNNPDEEPAVVQFGKEGKYFGVCVLLATMPGLPMFGHGQIEGFHEKYGMEFMRASIEEQPDPWLVERHQREVFPLLRKRYLFSEVENFYLYDFYTPDGHVDEDVFAYSNRHGAERALIVYHNKYKETRGWIRTSAGYLGPEGKIVQRTLGEGLGLGGGFLVFSEHIGGLEYIRRCEEVRERGLYLELGGFSYRVFWNMREVQDSAELPYARLETELAGAGVPSVEEAARELKHQAIHRPFYEAINPGSARYLIAGGAKPQLLEKMRHIADGLAYLAQLVLDIPPVFYEGLAAKYEVALEVLPRAPLAAIDGVSIGQLWVTWFYARAIAELRRLIDGEDDWRLERVIARTFREAGAPEDEARRLAEVLIALVEHAEEVAEPVREPHVEMAALIADPRVRAFLDVHDWEGVSWLKKERFEELAELWAFLRAAEDPLEERACFAVAKALIACSDASGYKVKVLEALLAAEAEAEAQREHGGVTARIEAASIAAEPAQEAERVAGARRAHGRVTASGTEETAQQRAQTEAGGRTTASAEAAPAQEPAEPEADHNHDFPPADLGDHR